MTFVKLKWAIPVLAAVISSTALACSSEPVLIERTVEVPAESLDVEATVEARVAAALATAIPQATAVARSPVLPTVTPTTQPTTAEATVQPTQVLEPTATPKRVSEDYYVILENGEIERFMDIPSLNIYTAKTGGAFAGIHIHEEFFLDSLLEEGVITLKQKKDYLSGGSLTISLDDFSVTAYKFIRSRGFSGKNDPRIRNGFFSKLLYYFDESSLDSEAGTATEPTATPKRVSEDYYVILKSGSIEYFADFPSLNVYRAETGGHYIDFDNESVLLDYLLREGVITPEQKNTYLLGRPIKISFDDFSVPIYKLLQANSLHGMENDIGLGIAIEWTDLLLHYFGESLLDNAPGTQALPTIDSFDIASVLARFSTTDPVEGEARADAASEIIAQYTSGRADTARVLNLLRTVAPELSIDERRRAADELATMSEDEQWDETETARAAFYLGSVITGEEPNPEERIEAANEMVILYRAGELDADNALNLMNTIAPGLSINERRQASGALAKLSVDGDWDDENKLAAASEVFRLVTGVPLNAEERIGAGVDLTGVGLKIFDKDDQFDDSDIDNAAEIIKQSLTGELTTDSLKGILGSND